MEKRNLVLFSVSVILILSISLISAGWFSDFFVKITGKTTEADTTRPISTISSISSTGVLSGTASDDVAISKVELAIYDYDNGLRYDGNSGQWRLEYGGSYIWFPVTGTASWSWNGGSILTVGHQYQLVSRATDTSNNVQNLAGSGSTTFIYSSTPCLLAITTSSLPNGMVGSSYSQQLFASGCSSPYNWYIDAYNGSSLPPGLSLSSTGEINGIPTTSGTYTFNTVVYKDNYNYLTTKKLTLTINPSSQPNAACTDSDGGKNYYVKGIFSGLWKGEFITNTDSCLNASDETGDDVYSSNYLGEGYCENNELKVERITCPNGCVNGACVVSTNETTCTDSDGGINYYVKGILNNGLEDYCMSDFISVAEYYCNSTAEGGFSKEFYKCPNGCVDGACVQPTNYTSSITVLSPNGGENWKIGNTYQIKWKSINVPKDADVQLSLQYNYLAGPDNGETSQFATTIKNTGSYNILIPQKSVTGEDIGGDKAYTIILESRGNGFDVRDVSNNPFSITSEGDCNNGCSLNGACYPYNNRKSGNYCAVGGQWLPQVADNGACENDFECSSYVCASSQCVEGSLIQKILAWFREFFG